jgi:hypothetical protein
MSFYDSTRTLSADELKDARTLYEISRIPGVYIEVG